jgi:cytochrome c biogenesis protein CcdA
MRMQEPEQGQSFEETGTTSQEYGAYRAESGYYEQEQKVYPQERHGSVLNTLITVFSALGWGPAILGIISSALTLNQSGGSSSLLLSGILGLIGSTLVLLCLVTIFILSVVSAARRATHSRRPRFR